MKYEQIHDGQWFRPVMKGHLEQCCHCGLVHQTDFKIDKDGKLWMRSKQKPKSTAAVRRKFNFDVVQDDD